MKWNTNIKEVFPKEFYKFNPDFGKITITELLSQHSGLQRDLYDNPFSWLKWKDVGTLTEQRLKVFNKFSTKQLLYKPGSKWNYSNVGYIIAAVMLEKISGKPFEQLMKQIIFKPLHMNNASFKGTNVSKETNQPWSHYYTGKPTKCDLPSVMNSDGKLPEVVNLLSELRLQIRNIILQFRLLRVGLKLIEAQKLEI